MAVSSYVGRKEMRIPSKGLLARSLEQQNRKQNENETVFKFSGRYDNVETNCEQSAPRNYKLQPKVPVSECKSIPDDVFGDSGRFSSIGLEINKVKSLYPTQNGFCRTKELPNQHVQANSIAEARHNSPFRSRNSSVEKPSLNCINEETDQQPSFNSTQQLRSGFFRSIKKQYPSLALDGLMASESNDSGQGDSITSDDGMSREMSFKGTSPERPKHSTPSSRKSSGDEDKLFMSSMARRRLQELREIDPTKVDVSTGLQWIRLELHEMREQDKALFLQLIKLHSTIKDLRSELNCVGCETDWSYDDLNDAASLWWPRYSSTGGSSSVTVLPDFSSSDGAQMLRKKRPNFRRGFSFNAPRPGRFGGHLAPLLSNGDATPFLSLSSSSSSIRSATAC